MKKLKNENDKSKRTSKSKSMIQAKLNTDNFVIRTTNGIKISQKAKNEMAVELSASK